MIKNLFQRKPKVATRNERCVDAGERVYAVGDIHGRYDLLNAMLERLSHDINTRSDGRRNRIIFLGDYIDRGDHSREVLDRLAEIHTVRDELERQTATHFEFLAGNHEVALLGFLEDPVKGRNWLGWGGRQTLASFGIVPSSGTTQNEELAALRDRLEAKLASHLPFLNSLSKLTVSGDVVFVHAGTDPAFSLQEQPDAAVFWGKNPSGKKPGLIGHRIVHGHYANDKPVSTSDSVCVDTGAYYSGRLTAVRLDSAESFLHVDQADAADQRTPTP